MKKSVNKLSALFLAVVMLFGASPIIGIGSSLIASAASESDLTFNLINNDTEYEVNHCEKGASGDLTIPSTYNGKPVTSIGNSAFKECTSIKSVTIPDSIKSIGDYAFEYCSSLQEADIAQGVEKIGSNAFYHTALTEITVPASVTFIDTSAFGSSSDLTTINVVETNTNYSSENGVLFNKTKTKLLQYPSGKADVTYTIPDGTAELGDYAFQLAQYLENLVVSSSVVRFSENALSFMSVLKTFTVDDDNTVFSSQDGVLFNKDKTVLYKYPVANARNSYTVPSSVIKIADNSFYNASIITSVALPDGLKAIGNLAFIGCTNLYTFSIPLSVESIGDDAFNYCGFHNQPSSWNNGLLFLDGWLLDVKSRNTEINIAAGTRGVADRVAKWCNNVVSVTVPASVEMIGKAAFTCAKNIAEITVDPNNPNYCAENNILFNKDKTELILIAPKEAPTAYVIPNSVTSIAAEAFCFSENLADITIPESVKRIGSSAFDYTAFMNNLNNWTDKVLYLDNCLLDADRIVEEVVIRPDTRLIGDSAFTYCSKLTGVQIPQSVEHIGKAAFENCNNMTSITIPNPATTIGEFAFYGVADDFVIKGYSGSVAETYAYENDIAFESISVSVTGVSLDITSKTLAVGGTQQLTATVAPEDATNQNVTWESSNPDVATVDENGLVTANSVGIAIIAVITADGSKLDFCTIRVTVPVTGVSLDITSKTLAVGVEQQLTATVTPDNATNKAVTWTSSDTAIATVDENGLVTAIAAGTATITVTTADGNKTATCEITVVVPVTGVVLDITSKTLAVGVEQQLTATVAPDNATNKNVTWASSDTAIATVDENGLVTAIAAGTATITVTTADGNKTATCEITVFVPVTGVALDIPSKTLVVGGTQQLTKTVAPDNATNKAVTWASSDTAIATVDENGLVTAIAAGTATITVTTADGSQTATCSVTVLENRVVKIDILTPMNTVRYTYKNSSLDKTGLSIKVTYLNDDTETIEDASKIDVSGFNAKQKGEQKLTVEYGGVPAEEKITVNVKYAWWQWLIMIFLFGWIWY